MASWTQDRPAEEQVRLRTLVGEERVLVELDRYGFAWLSFTAGSQSADFCLRPHEISFTAPPDSASIAREQVGEGAWSRLRKIKVRFAASTWLVLFAFVASASTGLAAVLFEFIASRRIPHRAAILTLAIPAVSLLLATLLSTAWWLRRRGSQDAVEFAACLSLWIVLFSRTAF